VIGSAPYTVKPLKIESLPMTDASSTGTKEFPKSTITSLGVIFLVAILDTCAWWAWDLAVISIQIALALHLLCASSFLLLRAWYKKIEENNAFPEIAFLFVLTLGPVGALGMAVTLSLYAHYRKKSTPFDIWYKKLVPQHSTTEQERSMERFLSLSKDNDFQNMPPTPFADVLSSGNQSEKRSMLTLMLRNYHSSFAPIFLQALNDSDSAIRVYAASMVSRIADNFHTENIELEKRKLDKPSDLKNLYQLAKHYDERATAGLSDEESLRQFRKKAQYLYVQLYKMQPSNIRVRWLLGRLLLRYGKHIAAANVFEGVLKLLDSKNEIADPFQLVWYWQCLYEQSRYAKLRQQIQKYRHQIPEDSILQLTVIENIDVWISPDSAAVTP